MKKKLKTFYHFFRTLSLFSRLFTGLESCWANFKTFSRIQDFCANPESGKRENWLWKTGAPYPSSQQYFPTHRCAKATLYIPRLFPGFSTISDLDGYLSKLACVASVSARVRRENWDESKKRNKSIGNACHAGYSKSTIYRETARKNRSQEYVVSSATNKLIFGICYPLLPRVQVWWRHQSAVFARSPAWPAVHQKSVCHSLTSPAPPTTENPSLK